MGHDAINMALLAGESISSLAERYEIPADAIFRHVRNHLSTGASGMSAVSVLPDLMHRVLQIADDAATARRAALGGGHITQAARLGDSELRALAVLGQRLGLDDTEVLEQLNAYAVLATALGHAIRVHPVFAPTLAEKLRALGAEGMAADVEGHANRVARELK